MVTPVLTRRAASTSVDARMGSVEVSEYYKSGHLNWRFGNRTGWRLNDKEEFDITYGRCQFEPLDFRSECVNTVKYLSRVAIDPLGILFSGGVDSEIICRSAKDAGIDFYAVLVRFENDLNAHDIDLALKLCSEYSWKYELIDFNITSWLEGGMRGLVNDYRLQHPEYSVHMEMLRLTAERGYFPIDGRGDISLINESGELVWYETEESLMPTKYLMDLGITGCPRFFKYSPELIFSWLTDPMMKRWVRYNVPLKMTQSHDFKTIIYSSYWEDLMPRTKYTGFEKILRLYRIHRDRISKTNHLTAKKRMIYADELARMAFAHGRS